MYKITKYTLDQAKKLGVTVRPSKLKNKKIDVIYNDKKIASVGHKDYKDFPTYLAERGEKFAKERQRLYKIRHAKNRKRIPGGIDKQKPGFFADRLLW